MRQKKRKVFYLVAVLLLLFFTAPASYAAASQGLLSKLFGRREKSQDYQWTCEDMILGPVFFNPAFSDALKVSNPVSADYDLQAPVREMTPDELRFMLASEVGAPTTEPEPFKKPFMNRDPVETRYEDVLAFTYGIGIFNTLKDGKPTLKDGTYGFVVLDTNFSDAAKPVKDTRISRKVFALDETVLSIHDLIGQGFPAWTAGEMSVKWTGNFTEDGRPVYTLSINNKSGCYLPLNESLWHFLEELIAAGVAISDIRFQYELEKIASQGRHQ